MALILDDASQRDTTLRKSVCLAQLPLGAQLGRRAWVHRELRVRVAEHERERRYAAGIVRRHHYLGRWAVRPRTKILWYVADLATATGVGIAMVVLQPGQRTVARALELHQCEVLEIARVWRSDDLGPAVAPDLTPEMVRRIVRGERGRGPLLPIRDEWSARKLDDRLRAVPRLLVAWADPAVGHDGALYTAAGASFCGLGKGGKLLFAWGLDKEAWERLRRYAAAVAERKETA
jgi:hypothetical protein